MVDFQTCVLLTIGIMVLIEYIVVEGDDLLRNVLLAFDQLLCRRCRTSEQPKCVSKTMSALCLIWVYHVFTIQCCLVGGSSVASVIWASLC